MFGDAQPHRGQLVHLAAFTQHEGRVVQRRPAGLTHPRPLLDHRVGRRHQVHELPPGASAAHPSSSRCACAGSWACVFKNSGHTWSFDVDNLVGHNRRV